MFSTRNCYSPYSAGLYIQSVPEKCVCPSNIHNTCYSTDNEVVCNNAAVLLNTDTQLYSILLTLEGPKVKTELFLCTVRA